MKRKKAVRSGKAKAKAKAKPKRKRPAVKDMSARKAGAVKGGLLPATTLVPAVQHKLEGGGVPGVDYKTFDSLKSIK